MPIFFRNDMTSTLRYSLPVGQLPPSKRARFFFWIIRSVSVEQFVRECPGNIVQGITYVTRRIPEADQRVSGSDCPWGTGEQGVSGGGNRLGKQTLCSPKA